MENNYDIDQLQDNVKKYINTRYELAVLKASEKVSVISGIATSAFIFALFFLMFILFLSVAAGFYLSTLLNSRSLGFLLIAAVYLLLGIIVLLFRKKMIIHPVRNKIIKAMFDDN